MNVQELEKKLSAYLEDEAPIKLESGGVICEGVDAELDEWKALAKGGQEWIAAYQQKLQEVSGLFALKIKYNKVFGYFIEVSSGQAKNVPEYFIRKQTLTNAERFTTQELSEYQDKILKAEEEVLRLENQIFQELCGDILNCGREIQDLAQEISEIDCVSSFAQLALENNYCKATVSEEPVLEIKDGRHPVVETLVDNFISNDSHFSENEKFILLSGPNMAGKSTYLRQNALILLLTHIGSFVPAKSATVGLADRIFTRVGAGDNLAAGESTFMIEMTESSTILHNATERSFIILDELGRGTSTFDGLSLAWSITEFLHNTTKARTIFATHYHELSELAENLENAKNLSVAVLENQSQGVVFLHKIVEGAADQSYGIEVGRLAGLPQSVLVRAEEVLAGLENKKTKQEDALQMSLFDNVTQSSTKNVSTKISEEQQRKLEKLQALEKKIQALQLNNLTPLEALNVLGDLQK